MIIRPQIKEKISLKNANGFEELYDPLGTKHYVKKRYALSKQGDVREESLDIDTSLNWVTKRCVFGKQDVSDPKIIDVKSSMLSTIDAGSGKLIGWGAECRSPSYNSTGIWLTSGLDQVYREEFDKTKYSYTTDKINHCFNGFDLEAIKSSVYAGEDILQMSYSDCIGLITAFFTQLSYSFPFDSYVILDTEIGFNVPNFKYLNVIARDSAKKLYAEYIKAISIMFDLLKYNCEKEKKKLRIYVFSSAYTTVIKIKDKEHKGLRLDYNLNASDHFTSLISNIEANGRWFMSEECGVLSNINYSEVSDRMIDTYYADVETIF